MDVRWFPEESGALAHVEIEVGRAVIGVLLGISIARGRSGVFFEGALRRYMKTWDSPPHLSSKSEEGMWLDR